MDAIAEAKRTFTWYMLSIAVLVLVLVAFISQRIGKNLTNPIKVLVDSTARVATGDLDEQCEIKTHDEIGDLAAAFNQMTQDLKQSRGPTDSSGTFGDSRENVCFVRTRDPKPVVIYADAGTDVDAET